MKPITGCYVDIEVGVVHPMKAPEDGEKMEKRVLQINDEIKGNDCQDYLAPVWQNECC